MVYMSYNSTLSSGKVISIEHTSSGSTVSLDNTQWNLCGNIPDHVWDSLSPDDKSLVTMYVDDAYSEWLYLNQHP